jgi:nucleoside-diphosphate-sugar epimerase
MKVLILGGTRFLGKRLAAFLLEAGAEVVLFHRGVTGEGSPGTVSIIGDRASAEDLERARDVRPHVVVDLSSYQAAWTRLSLQAFRGRVGHYVYVSSGAIYPLLPEVPWPETAPFGPAPIWGQYGQEKVASELMLWEAHRAGELALTVFRYPYILGPGNFQDRESFVLSRLEAGRPILLPGGGAGINQFVYVDDAAQAIVESIVQPAASIGHAFNCAYYRGITNRGFVELCAAVLDKEATIIPIDERELGVWSETPASRFQAIDLTNLVFPFATVNYLLDVRFLASQLGFEASVPLRRMIEEFVPWWLEREDRAPRRYEREELALRALASNPRTGGRH